MIQLIELIIEKLFPKQYSIKKNNGEKASEFNKKLPKSLKIVNTYL
jgi:hypothetical protein